MSFVRTHSSLLLALGAGLAIGATTSWLIQKLRRNISQDIALLVRQIDSLKQEVRQLRDTVQSPCVSSDHEVGDVSIRQNASEAYFSTQATSDEEDDEFLEATEGYGSDEDLLRWSSRIPGSRSSSNSSLLDLSNVPLTLSRVDQLLEGSDKDKERAFSLIKDVHNKDKNNVDVLWRLAKTTYFMSQIEGSRGHTEQKKTLVYQAKDTAEIALTMEDRNPDVQKWYAIALGTVGDYESTQVKILNGFKFKEHIEKAIQLRPDDASSHYLLGRWCYGVYMLSWVERKLAATLFASPPSSTIDEALSHFTQADTLSKATWKENLLFIGKCYIEKSEYYQAVDWLNKADKAVTISQDDRAAQKEIDSLLYKYSGYRR